MSDDVRNPDPERADGAGVPGTGDRELAALRAEVESLREVARHSPQRTRELEARLAHVQTSLSTLSSQNERLVRTLRDAREQIVTLKQEVDRLAQPPSTYGLVIDPPDDGAIDIITGGRKMRVAISPSVDQQDLGLGREVMLNEALNVVSVHGYERVGEVVTVKERIDHERVVVDHPRRRGARLPHRDASAGRAHPGRGLPHARPAVELRPRGHPEARGRGARPRGGPRRRLRGHRWPLGTDRADPRRRRAAVPAPRALQGARPQAAEGRPALRPSRLRQDPHRQGRRRIARHARSRRAPARRRRRATSSTSRAPSCSTSTSARPSATSGSSSSGRARRPRTERRSSSSSTRWTRCSAPAARASRATSRPRSCRSCSPRSTASSASTTSSSSAPPTART